MNWTPPPNFRIIYAWILSMSRTADPVSAVRTLAIARLAFAETMGPDPLQQSRILAVGPTLTSEDASRLLKLWTFFTNNYQMDPILFSIISHRTFNLSPTNGVWSSIFWWILAVDSTLTSGDASCFLKCHWVFFGDCEILSPIIIRWIQFCLQ